MQTETLPGALAFGIVLEVLAARVAAGMANDLPVPMYYMEGGKYFRELL